MKFCWVTINVSDMQKSLEFYRDILGLEVMRTMKPNPEMELNFLGKGETQVELIWDAKGSKEKTFGKDIFLGFEVESLEAIMEILKKKNIQVLSGPHQPSPAIRFIFVIDPDGARIQFVENIKK